MVRFPSTGFLKLGGLNRFRVASLALLAAAALVMGHLPASASPGTQVAFVIDTPFDGSPEMALVSSVPGCPAATVITSPEGFAVTGNVARFSGTKELDCGSSGTFTLAYRAHTLVCSPTDSGTWKIVGGTGMYEGMTGQGKVSGTYYGADPCEHDGVIDAFAGTLRLETG